MRSCHVHVHKSTGLRLLCNTLQFIYVDFEKSGIIENSVGAAVLRSMACMHQLRSFKVELLNFDDGSTVDRLPLPCDITKLYLYQYNAPMQMFCCKFLGLECKAFASSLSTLQSLQHLYITVDELVQGSSPWQVIRQWTALTYINIAWQVRMQDESTQESCIVP